jgi:hypothetical protein
MLASTSTEHAPWHVIPEDKKWFMRQAVAETMLATLESLDLSFPVVSATQKRELEECRAQLIKEKRGR